MGSPAPSRTVLVTGASGNLGRHAVAALAGRSDASCRALSRGAPPEGIGGLADWRRADLLADPLGPVLEDVDAIVHLASGKGPGDADVTATGRLLEAARAAGVRHAVVISIIGCDRIPLPFYGSKVRIEALAEASGIAHSVVRVAQFHSFVARLVAVPATLPVPAPIVADLRFQPIDEAEAAGRLVELALGPALGRAPELAGPEVLTLGRAVALWFAAAGRQPTLVPVALSEIARTRTGEPSALEGPSTAGDAEPAGWTFGVLDGYRAAWNTPQGERWLGRVTFADWLAAHPAQAGIR